MCKRVLLHDIGRLFQDSILQFMHASTCGIDLSNSNKVCTATHQICTSLTHILRTREFAPDREHLHSGKPAYTEAKGLSLKTYADHVTVSCLTHMVGHVYIT